MTQQDYKIREALIALLCVGDTIYHLATNQSDYNANTQQHNHYHLITNYIISEIISNKKIRVGSRWSGFIQDLSMVDEYNGKLYIWNIQGWYAPNKYELRVQRMKEYIESPYTKIIDLEPEKKIFTTV
jgi:hypothetical protein